MTRPYLALLLAALLPACDPSKCGNGKKEAGEICDDGNQNDHDGCGNDCTHCGNGILDPGEECDDGNKEEHDDCSAKCKATPRMPVPHAPATPSKGHP